MSTLETRARLAAEELVITAEAHEKLRAHYLKEALVFAKAGDQPKAYQALLNIIAVDTVRQLVGAPIEDLELERAIASTGQASN